MASRALRVLVGLLVASARGETVHRREAKSDGSTPEWAPPVFEEDQVLYLGAGNITDARARHPHMLITFFAPWCSHSAAIAPEIAAAAKQLADSGVVAKLAKVDAIAHETLAAEHGIDTYPMILWFSGSDGAGKQYRGGRTQAEIASWVTRRVLSGSPSGVLESADAAVRWASEAVRITSEAGSVAVVVLVLLPSADSIAFGAYAHAAHTSSDAALFSHTTSEDVYDAAIAKAAALLAKRGAPLLTRAQRAAGVRPAAMVIKSHEDGIALMPPLLPELAADPNALTAALSELVTHHVLPPIVPFTEAYEDEIYAGAITAQLVVVGSKASLAEQRTTLEGVARAFKGEALVIFADVEDDASDGLLAFFDVEPDPDEPLRYLGFDVAGETKYAPPAALVKLAAAGTSAAGTALGEALSSFVRSVVDGTATPIRLSEAPPARNDAPVTLVVADTFDELVTGSGKDVLLEIHAPWCGHCKALAPEYNALGERFRDVEGVTIARIDGTKNEVAGLEYDGYPTLLLYTAKTRRVVEAGEDVLKTADGLEAFVRQHAEGTLPPAKGGKEEL